MQEIAIAIQIRDSSTRLPGKGTMKLLDEPIYKLMIKNVGRCVSFINKHSDKKKMLALIYFLVPYNEFDIWDNLVKKIPDYHISVIPGNPDDDMDVFYRYEKMFNLHKPNYIVRLTGDCPFIPSALINKAINCAVHHDLDYISNVDPRYRTMPDGFDVECISDEAFLWLSQNVDSGTKEDREHVTTYLRKISPSWMRIATITGSFDQYDLKYSIDTKEDFDDLEKRFNFKVQKELLARKNGLYVYDY